MSSGLFDYPKFRRRKVIKPVEDNVFGPVEENRPLFGKQDMCAPIYTDAIVRIAAVKRRLICLVNLRHLLGRATTLGFSVEARPGSLRIHGRLLQFRYHPENVVGEPR